MRAALRRAGRGRGRAGRRAGHEGGDRENPQQGASVRLSVLGMRANLLVRRGIDGID